MPMTQTTTDQPPVRQRVEGALHRSLPATLTIRQAEAGQADDGLLRLHLSVSSETPYLRSSWWDDPWIEILGHKTGEVDLARLQDGAPVLANHDRWMSVGNTPLAAIGVIERAELADGRLECDIVISRREALADLRQDIADGLVRNVSIGYTITERTLTKAAPTKSQPDEYRVTNWTPFEVSLVDIPADATVGLGRSLDAPDLKNPESRYRVIDITTAPVAGASIKGEITMPQTNTPAAESTVATTTVTDRTQASSAQDALAADRERAREIRATGRQFDMVEQADQAIDNGTSVESFRKLVLERMKDNGSIRPAESSEIGMSRRDVEQYSFCRALLAAQDPVQASKLAPFEMECSRAAQDKREISPKDREAAITIPVDVLHRGITLAEDVAAAVTRQMIANAARSSREAPAFYRDLLTATPGAGGNTVATELWGSSFIELLRNAMILDNLGITWLRDLSGNVAIPSQTGTATAYWVAENAAPTESQQIFGQVTLTPKTVGAFTDYSRRLLLQSSLDIEAFVRADLAAVLGLAIQQAAIAGSGTGNEPLGLLNTSGIGSVPGGANGAPPTYEHMVDLETAIANVNADVGSMAYLTNSKVRGKLRKTQVFSGTNGSPVWTSGRERGIGEMLGYDAVVSNAVPSNLTKGTSSGVCSSIAFGYWADLLLGMWGGLDIMLDPYTGATSGTRRVIALQDVDVQLRNPVSFAAMKDALTN